MIPRWGEIHELPSSILRLAEKKGLPLSAATLKHLHINTEIIISN